MAGAVIGDVRVRVTPDADGFWRDFEARTSGQAAAAGAAARREFNRGLNEGRGPEVRVRADTSQARREIDSLRNDTNQSSGGMIANLAALAPALTPFAGAALAAAAEVGILGVSGILAFGGIKREMQAGTPVGQQYTSLLKGMSNTLHGLQTTAASGVLTGFAQAQAKLAKDMPVVNTVIQQQSRLLGSVVSHLVGGLAGGFVNFLPILDQVGGSIDRVAAKFEAFATGPGGAKFGSVLSADYAKIAPIFDELVHVIEKVIIASHNLGTGLLGEVGLIIHALNLLPVWAVEALIAAFVTFKTAAALTATAQLVGAGASSIRASLLGMQAGYQSLAGTSEAAQLQQASAAAATASTVAAAAAEVATAQAAQAQAVADSQASIAASLAGTGSIFEEEAGIAATASAEEAASFQAAARAAQLAADEKAAAAERAALAAREAGAGAAGGFSAALGPLGLLAAGLLILPALFHNDAKATVDAAAAHQTYADALKDTTNLLSLSAQQATLKNLQDAKADDIAKSLTGSVHGLNLSLAAQTLAINGTDAQFNSYYNSLLKIGAANVQNTEYLKNTGLTVNDVAKDFDKFGHGAPASAFNDTGLAALKLANVMRTLRASLTDEQKQQLALIAAQNQLQVSLDGGSGAAAAQARAMGLTTDAYITGQVAAQKNTDQTSKQTAAFQLENNAAALLDQTLKGLGGVNLDVATAQTSLLSANAQVAASFKANGRAIQGSSAAAIANQQAIQQQVQASQQYAAAIGKRSGSAQREIQILRQSRDGLLNQLAAQGKLTPAVRDYITHLYNLRAVSDYLTKHPTNVDAKTAAANAKVHYTQSLLDNMKQRTPPKLDMDNRPFLTHLDDAARRLADLHDKTIIVNLLPHDPAGLLGQGHSSLGGNFASGGYTGDGGKYEPAGVVHRGEFVFDADTTSKNRRLFEAIAGGGRSYADGGHVSDRPSPAASAVPAGQVNNFTINEAQRPEATALSVARRLSMARA